VNEGVNIPPRGQISLLGARGEVMNGPQLTVCFTYNFCGNVTRLMWKVRFSEYLSFEKVIRVLGIKMFFEYFLMILTNGPCPVGSIADDVFR
jgi:hypothetical protein